MLSKSRRFEPVREGMNCDRGRSAPMSSLASLGMTIRILGQAWQMGLGPIQ